jgi:hypothetical protein
MTKLSRAFIFYLSFSIGIDLGPSRPAFGRAEALKAALEQAIKPVAFGSISDVAWD